MNTALLVRRPLGCLKASLRQTRQQNRVFPNRHMATATATASKRGPIPSGVSIDDHNFYRIIDPKTKKTRTAFAVYTPPETTSHSSTTTTTKKRSLTLPKLISPPADPLPALHAQQIKRMDPTGARTALFAKTRTAARVGDILMVTHRRGGEPFAGVLLSIRRAGIDTAILLRNHLAKVGVEMWYKIYNKNVAGIEIVKRAKKRARRARLTYMRKPKHDMGSVSEVVLAWRKMRRVVATSKAASKAKVDAKAKKAGKAAGAKKAK
ncbi:translation protein SH3-like domain-containing protein [Apodospora peruviana]|uniref:Translation protein SH3-like domain-containing protein n=1 Tax=Apodospora peruviana TaxID=516989 RepID=A0AAE0ICM7_9PEZI|nr:translation protein SH3-like domain-containing protein [Apodospora peruviana]